MDPARLAFVPGGIAYSVTALLGLTLMERQGLRVVVAGCLVTAEGLAPLTWRTTTTGADSAVAAGRCLGST